jgi:hypothetical protein
MEKIDFKSIGITCAAVIVGVALFESCIKPLIEKQEKSNDNRKSNGNSK